MSQPAAEAPQFDPAAQLETEIEEAISLCGGDVRAALRVTLIANEYLQGEVDRLTGAVSVGFARGRVRRRANGAPARE
jgi:hypothetical protein